MWDLVLHTLIIVIVSFLGGFISIILLISAAKLVLLLCMKLMHHIFHNIANDARNCGQNANERVNNINDFEKIHQKLYAKLTCIFRVIPSNFTNATKRQSNPSDDCGTKDKNRYIKGFLPGHIKSLVTDSTTENDKLTNDSHSVNKRGFKK